MGRTEFEVDSNLQGVCIPRLLSSGYFPLHKRTRSNFLSRNVHNVPGIPYLATSLEGPDFDTLPRPLNRGLIHDAVEVVSKLHGEGAVLNSLYWRNFLVAADGKGVRLVDLCHTFILKASDDRCRVKALLVWV